MKAVELRKQTAADLDKEISKWQEKIAKLVRERTVSEQKNVREVRYLRKDIARALTIMSEKKREEKA